MRAKVSILLALSIISIPATASASLNGKEDFSEPRIMAVSMTKVIGSTPWANGSGYLYSPRIIFSAGHMKDQGESTKYYVSQPNQKLKKDMESVNVIKIFYPDSYNRKTFADDFSIIVLEKPLAKIAPAPLVTRELLARAISDKTPMKITGYGVYQDKCLEIKKAPPCNSVGDRTSLVPRSSLMTPWSASEIRDQFNQYQEEVADHLFMTAPYKGGPCGGDSGGSTTVLIDGISYYVGTVPSGFWNAYACGQSAGVKGVTLGYTAPVYKFLDLIAKAEKYVAEHPYSPPKATSKQSTSKKS
ncbi:Serine proteases, trypsin domain containing protein [Candidatus Nanopelagicaceae bacterium]